MQPFSYFSISACQIYPKKYGTEIIIQRQISPVKSFCSVVFSGLNGSSPSANRKSHCLLSPYFWINFYCYLQITADHLRGWRNW